MYERFSDRSRKVMQLANQAAQKFNHEYIGTEHILIGLVTEGSGMAWAILDKLNIGPVMIRTEIEKLVQAGPDMVTMGKLPQTPRSKKVIEYAMENARKLNHNYVGTEHILLGLLQETDGIAAHVLRESFGLTYEQVYKIVEEFNVSDAENQKRVIESRKEEQIAEIDAQVKLASIKGRLMVIAKMVADVLEDLK